MDRLPALCGMFQGDPLVIFAYLFGGCATGPVKPVSDIDLAVYLSDTESIAQTKLDLFSKISDVLGTSEIDLVVLNVSSVSITGRVLQNRRLLVDKHPFIRHRFESSMLRQFFDFRKKEETLLSLRYGLGR
ncbi:MAG TPA: nucleotidyltransferase domain-containing protein [Candidatus Deferrimicrobiaceae bacterium]|jgi:predicted nucleotidyltransferase